MSGTRTSGSGRVAETHRGPEQPSTKRRHRAGALVVGGLALGALLVAACSDDDSADRTTTTEAHDGKHDEPTGTDPDPTGPAPLEGEPMSSDACGHFATLGASMTSGDPTVAGPSLELFAASLPAELTTSGTTVVDGLGAAFEGDEEAMFSPAFTAAYEEVGDAMWAGCEAQARLDVTGVDYGFEGLPSTTPAGMTALRFTNGTSSAEPHELIVLQRPPGDTTPIEEIAEMAPEKVMEDFPMIGVVFVDTPEASSTTFIDLPAGRYVAICTIPVGGAETGDPHAAHGMIAELETV